MKSTWILAGVMTFSIASVEAATTAGISAPETLRWDFSGVFNTTFGTGSGLAGMGDGASISGSIEAAPDFEFYYAYHKFDGNLTIYSYPSAVLRYTVGSSGVFYTYSLTGIYALITQKDVGNAYRVELTAPFFQIAKDVTGSEISDPTFQSFSNAMALGMGDGTGHILIADGFWVNANMATISSLSMTVVPEFSSVALSGIGMLGMISRRRRSPVR